MNELEAALGIGCLEHYDEILSTRHHNLMNMIAHFNQYSEYFISFAEEFHETIGPHAFPLVMRENCPFDRDELMIFLEKNGIDARTLFSSIPTQCGGYEFLGYKIGDFPCAEFVGLNGIHIGVHQGITDADVNWLMEKIALFIKKTSKC
ncbi:hypothetical protein D1AOALGA4SA_9707 [Olavius algarvensis Delta 1 endosymbiont]|nr:hypothetical protein D1AOALGA4SA_9707 [Olavius algarvensis Delta 1 endosymbiont]